jgi:type IV pilus assembly protein PilP
MAIGQIRLVRAVTAALVAAVAAACSSNMNDLRVYIDEVKSRPGGRIEPLPTIRPAPTYTYVAGDRRSPFMPDTPQQRVASNPNATEGPDPNRPREFLEQFPLDSFRMVGSLEIRNVKNGLVQGADGLVHSITVGNHLGQNYGRVTSITDSEIQLVEIVPDGLGGYMQRPASIGLSD